jgi:DNA-binding transcriptional MocR family regulator
VIERVAELKQVNDVNTSTFDQHVAERVMRSGLLDEQIAEARPHHRARAGWMYEALRDACGDLVRTDPPEGGMSLWCELRTGHGSRELLTAAHEQSLSFATGDVLSADGRSDQHFRLAIGSLTEPLAREVAQRLRTAIDSLEARRPRAASRRSGTRALI